MKTEMQQLEENTKLQYARERAEDIGKRLIELLEIELETVRWVARAGVLSAFVFLSYFAIILLMLYLKIPDNTHEIIADIHFIILLVAVARESKKITEWQRAQGERKGFEEALKMLGMLDVEECDCDNCKGKKKKKRVFESPFKRFKELWERLGSKNKQEAYGAA